MRHREWRHPTGELLHTSQTGDEFCRSLEGIGEGMVEVRRRNKELCSSDFRCGKMLTHGNLRPPGKVEGLCCCCVGDLSARREGGPANK
jgi:hypothetical protein